MSFDGKVIAVTGGAGGIGGAIGRRFAEQGGRVVLLDLDEAATIAVAKPLGAEAMALDVRDDQHVATVFSDIESAFGPLDVLVNSAAVPHVSPVLDITAEDWRRVIDINLTGLFFCSQAGARSMIRGGGGRIINISSVNGQRAISGRGAYSAAKGGVQMLTAIMAAELGDKGITVNAIAPAPVNTDMIKVMHTQATREAWNRSLPIKRYAEPEEVAAAAAFLASDEAGYINGHTLNLDGGFNVTGMLFDLS